MIEKLDLPNKPLGNEIVFEAILNDLIEQSNKQEEEIKELRSFVNFIARNNYPEYNQN